MAIGKKIRIYDLARELKQDANRVMEEFRREGADVSVPSNSVTAELAEKIRLRYFPKAEVAPKRAIKVIKATKKEDAAAGRDDSGEASPAEEVAAEPVAAEPMVEPVVEVPSPAADEFPAGEKPRSVYKLQKKAAPKAEENAEAVETLERTVQAETPGEAVLPETEGVNGVAAGDRRGRAENDR